MNEQTEKKCVNCRVPVTKGIYCQKCDAVIFSAWALEDYQSDPIMRMDFLNTLENDGIDSTFSMKKKADEKKSLRLTKLSAKIYRLLYKMDLQDHLTIFRRAVSLAKSRAENEINASDRLATLTAEKNAMKAVRDAYDSLRQDNHITEFDPTPDRNRKAYATFDPTESDPDQCPF